MIPPDTEITLVQIGGDAVVAQRHCRQYEDRGYMVLSVAVENFIFTITLRSPRVKYINYTATDTDGGEIDYQMGPYPNEQEAEKSRHVSGMTARSATITAKRDQARTFIPSKHA